jgi:hypothetical protein
MSVEPTWQSDDGRVRSPHPLDDPLGYALWLDLHECHQCKGAGVVHGLTCESCGGKGIDPDFADGDFFAAEDSE